MSREQASDAFDVVLHYESVGVSLIRAKTREKIKSPHSSVLAPAKHLRSRSLTLLVPLGGTPQGSGWGLVGFELTLIASGRM